jgi:putative PIN family toxin of toxin-antitoxin system
MRVILDTSVIVRGLISPQGPSARIITYWINGAFTLLYMPPMLAELEDVLHRTWLADKLAHVPNHVPEFLEAVTILGELVDGYANVAGAVRDPFDEMFLVCALVGNADYLVSGDKDLLDLGHRLQVKLICELSSQELATIHE